MKIYDEPNGKKTTMTKIKKKKETQIITILVQRIYFNCSFSNNYDNINNKHNQMMIIIRLLY